MGTESRAGRLPWILSAALMVVVVALAVTVWMLCQQPAAAPNAQQSPPAVKSETAKPNANGTDSSKDAKPSKDGKDTDKAGKDEDGLHTYKIFLKKPASIFQASMRIIISNDSELLNDSKNADITLRYNLDGHDNNVLEKTFKFNSGEKGIVLSVIDMQRYATREDGPALDEFECRIEKDGQVVSQAKGTTQNTNGGSSKSPQWEKGAYCNTGLAAPEPN